MPFLVSVALHFDILSKQKYPFKMHEREDKKII